jgi:hypothetical protein
MERMDEVCVVFQNWAMILMAGFGLQTRERKDCGSSLDWRLSLAAKLMVRYTSLNTNST